MSGFEAIDGATVPGWSYVYIVGSADDRITFFSQQARGFNLAHELWAAGVLKERRRFAVIGAGAAGLAVASGLALHFPNAEIDIFEREQHPLHLQRDCHRRNLHPHIYEWPLQGATLPRAGLPWLDWEAGAAHDVAKSVRRQFSFLEACHERLKLKLLHEVTGLIRLGADYRVTWWTAGRTASASYGAVFFTLGFGRERELAGTQWRSYWSDNLPEPPKYAAAPLQILVTGSGDGGLIDLCAAALQDLDHTALIDLVTRWPGISQIHGILEEIDDEAERFGRGFDFISSYNDRIGQALDEMGLVARIGDSLRQRVRVTFNTERAQALEQPTSTLNRLLAYLLFRAAAAAGHPIAHVAGAIQAGHGAGRYVVNGGGDVEAGEIFVRHGANKAAAFDPFRVIYEAYKPHHDLWLAADPTRRRPPRLAEAARAALGGAITDAGLPVLRHVHDEAVAQQPLRARISVEQATGRVLWGGDVEPEALLRWWDGPDRMLRLELNCAPVDLGALACAVARFAVHAQHVQLESDDPSWNAWLSSLTHRSPHAQAMTAPTVRATSGGAMASTPQDGGAVATSLQATMDRWTLAEIDRHLTQYLSSGSEEANWVAWRLAPDLRAAMETRWADWRARLRIEGAMLSRLFRLSSCTLEDDQGDLSDRQVLVGPHRLPSLVRSLVLALAAAEAWPTSGLRADAPGNFERRGEHGEALAHIHATGAELIEGESLAIRAVRHPWRTELVLLSELSAPAAFEAAADRSFREAVPTEVRLDAAPEAYNVIVGVDMALLAALEDGVAALTDHLMRTEQRLREGWRMQLDLRETEG